MPGHWHNRLKSMRFSFTCWCDEDPDEVAAALLHDYAHALSKQIPLVLERTDNELTVEGPFRYQERKAQKLWAGTGPETWKGPPDIRGIASAQISVEAQDKTVRTDVVLSFGESMPGGVIFALFVTAFFAAAIGLGEGFLPGLSALCVGILITAPLWWLFRVLTARQLRKVLVRQAKKHGRT